MPKSLNFYFGTVVFFLGVLMAAVGVANVIAQRLDFMVLTALIIGLVLIAIGFVVSKGKRTHDMV
ncbi:MAG TPA: hypothetical protein VMW36_11535 [Patescibacteria group bacterium]|nr:hypothetical protein [Patescibacteria group bacterium]